MSLPDREFERILLASARADEPAADERAEMTARAWSRFSARAALLGGATRGPEGWGGGQSPALGSAVRSAAGSVPWRWLLVGALGGSALTGALFVLRSPTQISTPVVHVEEAPPAATPVLPASAPGAPASRASERRAVAAPRREVRRTAQIDRSPVEAPAESAAPASTLSAEVAALDAARAAVARGGFDEALQLISRYHYDFPLGELAADAEVIAIEALDGKHDRAEMLRRAARFVEQHPDDPHAARIKRLLGSPPPR